MYIFYSIIYVVVPVPATSDSIITQLKLEKIQHGHKQTLNDWKKIGYGTFLGRWAQSLDCYICGREKML